MAEPYRSFMPVLTIVGARRKGETEAQWGRRFQRLADRYNRILALRVKLSEASLPSPVVTTEGN